MNQRKRLLVLASGAVLALGLLGGCSESYHIGHRSSWYGGSFGTHWNSGSYYYYGHKSHYGHGHHHRPHYGHGHHGGQCY